MKKINPYLKLNQAELQTKQKEFIKDLVVSRLTMDATALTTATNLQNLLRELKTVARVAAIKKKVQKMEEVKQ